MNLGKHSEIIGTCLQSCINNVPNVGNIYVLTGSTSLPFKGVQVIDEGKLLDEDLSTRYIESRLGAEHSAEILADKYFRAVDCASIMPEERNPKEYALARSTLT